jgi:hypothetical protein
MDAPRAPSQAEPWLFGHREEVMMDVKVIGIDIAKRYFQIHAIGTSGAVTLRKKLTRDSFLKLMAGLPPC